MVTDTTGSRGWRFSVRLGFRVAFIYWLIFCLDQGLPEFLLWMVPGLSYPVGWLVRPGHLAAVWLGTHLFGLTGVAATEHPTTAGDTALQYVFCFCSLVFALVAGAVWSAFSERRRAPGDYRTLYAWLRLGLRFALGSSLLVYGFDKVFDLQFPAPGLLYLTQTVGDSSPMRLLWAFMGASVPYTLFGGLAEVVPGFLLLFRRTSTLGALLAAGVLLNVVLLNFCYDVPVKLYSLHLLLIALFLLLPDCGSLARLFFRGEAAALTGLHLPPWERRPLRRASQVLQVLVVAGLIYQTGLTSYRGWMRTPVGRAPIYGIWRVDQPQDQALPDPWSTLIFDRLDHITVLHPDGSRDLFPARFDPKTQRVAFPEAEKPSDFHWANSADGKLLLAGNWQGRPVALMLTRQPIPETFALQTRGFHWVQEFSYNR